MTRTRCALLGTLAILLVSSGLANAQSDSGRLIRIIVAWPPASLGDVITRIVAEPLSAELGQRVIVENRAGATGMIGADAVAKAAPDGSVYVMTGAPLTMLAAMGKETPYKWPDSFTPVVNMLWSPLLLVAHPSLNVKTPQELVALARQKPGQLFYAMAGVGSPSHLFTELFLARSGIDVTPVAFPGSPQAMIELVAGRVAFYFTATSAALPQVREKAVTALGVTSRKRLDVAPEIPTMAEQGLTGFPVGFWNGLLGPAGLPIPVAERMAAAMNKVLARADVQQRAAPFGNELDGQSEPKSFAAMLKDDYGTWAELTRVAKIKPD